MSRLYYLALILVLSSCTDINGAISRENPKLLETSDFISAKNDAQAFLGENQKILAVCGGSVGRGIYFDDPDGYWEKSDISDGVIIFTEDQDGLPDIAFRDALKSMQVVSRNGGEIVRLGAKEGVEGLWSISYPESSEIETHNIGYDRAGNLMNIWTLSKPKNSLLPRANLFLSACRKI